MGYTSIDDNHVKARLQVAVKSTRELGRHRERPHNLQSDSKVCHEITINEQVVVYLFLLPSTHSAHIDNFLSHTVRHCHGKLACNYQLAKNL